MSNANTFSTFSRIEDSMIRASMPRTSASDPVQSATAKRLTAARTWIHTKNSWRDGLIQNEKQEI